MITSRVVLVVAARAISATTSELKPPTAVAMTSANGCSASASPAAPSTLTPATATAM